LPSTQISKLRLATPAILPSPTRIRGAVFASCSATAPLLSLPGTSPSTALSRVHHDYLHEKSCI
jgi:hypothetical protein